MQSPNDTSPDATAATTTWSSLEPYAQLVRVLLPRMTGLSVFNARAEVCWSSQMMAIDSITRRLIAESLCTASENSGQPGEMLLTDVSEPLYLFWLRRDGEEREVFAIVAVRCRASGDAEPPQFSYVHALVRPAMECLRRELLARREIVDLQGSVAEHAGDLTMLLAVAGSGAERQGGSADELKAILASAAQHMSAGLAALIVPEKNLVLVHAGESDALDPGLVAKAHRHLLSMAQMRREAMIATQVRLHSGNDAPRYSILTCPVLRGDGTPMGVLALFRRDDIAEFTSRHTRLTELVARRIGTMISNSYDALTGLLTRPAFELRVHSALKARQGSASWSALYLDMNRMHVINDTFGMHVGDRVLTQVGELIRQRMPPGALAARISGDRFAVLLLAELQVASNFAEALRQGVEKISAQIGDGSMQVSASIGVAAVDARCQGFTHAFAAAETACKAANDRGRNRVEVFEESDASIIKRFTDINTIGDLRTAMTENRLLLNAQLLAPLSSRHRAPHFEILLRMINASGVTVGPDHFLSAAQRYQIMPEIDRWVIGRAIEMLKPHAALLAADPVVFTINFSGQSLGDAGFTDHVAALIQSSGINPAALCFELTESAAVGNLKHAEELMRRFRKLGCGIALDDFGTGLSSLAYLRSLPINMLKIDGSFVRDVLRDPKAESMIQVVAQLARAMNLVTVAEYVETDEIRMRVAQLGVDYGQGFALGRPMPLADVLAQLPLYAAAAARPAPQDAPPIAIAV